MRLDAVRLAYPGHRTIVSDATLHAAAGETIAILGPSGGGKTTILKAIAGLLRPTAGRLEVLGRVSPDRPPRGAIGYVPQRLGLLPHESALHNVIHGGLHRTPWWRSLLHLPTPELEADGRRALASVALADQAERPVSRMSGGQQRRVAIARALVQRPRVLLADEFLGELDPQSVDTVLAAVAELRRQTGVTTIFVEHGLEQAQRIADRVLRLERGVLVDITEAVHAT